MKQITNVSHKKRHDIAEILLKMALNTNQSINLQKNINSVTLYTQLST